MAENQHQQSHIDYANFSRVYVYVIQFNVSINIISVISCCCCCCCCYCCCCYVYCLVGRGHVARRPCLNSHGHPHKRGRGNSTVVSVSVYQVGDAGSHRHDPLVIERWNSITVLLTCSHQCRRLVKKGRPCVIMSVL